MTSIKRIDRVLEHNVYSSNYALCASIGKNKAKTSWVLNLLMSKRIPQCDRYDREGGNRIQITERELSDFLASLTGTLPTLEIDRISKKLKIVTDVNDIVLISLRTNANNSAGMVRVELPDRLKLAAFCFNALMRNNGGVGQDVLYMMHRDIYRVQKQSESQ